MFIYPPRPVSPPVLASMVLVVSLRDMTQVCVTSRITGESCVGRFARNRPAAELLYILTRDPHPHRPLSQRAARGLLLSTAGGMSYAGSEKAGAEFVVHGQAPIPETSRRPQVMAQRLDNDTQFQPPRGGRSRTCDSPEYGEHKSEQRIPRMFPQHTAGRKAGLLLLPVPKSSRTISVRSFQVIGREGWLPPSFPLTSPGSCCHCRLGRSLLRIVYD